MTNEQYDAYMANRLCELPAIMRSCDRADALRSMNSDANRREWQDCLESSGYASCDTRGVIRHV